MEDILNFLKTCHHFSIVYFVLAKFVTTLLLFRKTLDNYLKYIIIKIYPLQKKIAY